MHKFETTNEDNLMVPALKSATIAAKLGNYFIGAALFSCKRDLIATSYGAGMSAGEIFHAETQLAVLLRAGRACNIFSNNKRYIIATTLQPCPQCRQICIQQKNLTVIYGSPTSTSGAKLGDLLETYTNTEKIRISENSGQPVIRKANLSQEIESRCINGHKKHRSSVLKTANEVSNKLMPFTDLLDFVTLSDPTVLTNIRDYQNKVRTNLISATPNLKRQ
tara:strand:+ start:325 stop:987 length:663 start_codon:yes stop_codon:yes gene_type:complete